MKKIVLLLIVIASLTRCSDEILDDTIEEGILPERLVFNDEVSFNGEYLEYASPEVFEETLLKIRNSEDVLLMQWFEEIGFNSAFTIYEKAKVDEQNFLEDLRRRYEKYSSEELEKIEKPKIEHSNFIKKNKSILKMTDDGLIEGVKVFNSEIAKLVNKDCIIKVAGHLFQYNDANVKIIEGGDENKLALLNKVTQTDEGLGIVVNPTISQFKGKSDATARDNYFIEVSETNQRNTKRVRGWMDLRKVASPIYGAQVCVEICDDALDPVDSGGGIPLVDDSCYMHCYRPITGYSYKTFYEVRIKAENKFLWWWSSYKADSLWIYCSWEIYNKYGSTGRVESNESEFGIVIYNGPFVDFSHSFAKWELDPKRGLHGNEIEVTHSFYD